MVGCLFKTGFVIWVVFWIVLWVSVIFSVWVVYVGLGRIGLCGVFCVGVIGMVVGLSGIWLLVRGEISKCWGVVSVFNGL